MAQSLGVEAGDTTDPVLRSEHYDLIAKQVRRKKMVLVKEDFAFRVLDPPAASDKAYRPKVLLDAIIVGLVALLAGCVVVVFKGEHSTHLPGG